jgi:5'-nucleotidase
MKLLRMAVIFTAVFFSFSVNLLAAEKLITIVHTNDLHSHLQGFSPEIDYQPFAAGADKTLGGWSRIATIIKKTKRERKNTVLVLDSGDYTMGSLFHLLVREEAFELRLLKAMGYDAVTLGNHEFDLKPAGLARMLTAAKACGGMPQIVFASAIFDKKNPSGDGLKEAFREVGIKDYTVLTRAGIRIGIFGIMGRDAAAVALFAKSVTFGDPIKVSRKIVGILREKEKVDIVICLSHSGLSTDAGKSEDEILARNVKGIDVIISGHTPARHQTPVKVSNTIIVHAGVYGKHVGILDIACGKKNIVLKNYKTVTINSSIVGDAAIQKTIEGFKQKINAQFLAGLGLSYDKVIAHTNWDLEIGAYESPLGNMIADSIRWYVNKVDSEANDPSSHVAVAVESNGIIRDNLIAGNTGRITVGDLFRTIPLGIGMGKDSTMGYPLISFYLYGYEIKRVLEILTSVYPRKGYDYFLQISGLRFTYNPHRVIFDRVTNVEMGSEEEGYKKLDYSQSNDRLYRAAVNIYNATFLKAVGNYTYHFLDIVPKDKNGKPVKNLSDVRVNADKTKRGIQELKEWQGVIEYVRSFRDTNGDGISDLPEKYKTKLGRIVIEPSWHPGALIAGATLPTLLALLLIGLLFFAIIYFTGRIINKRRAKNKYSRWKIKY